jgi:hypothetical protein
LYRLTLDQSGDWIYVEAIRKRAQFQGFDTRNAGTAKWVEDHEWI